MADYLFLLIKGELRMEKDVIMKSENFWPISKKNWEATEVEKRVSFNIKTITGNQVLAENEVLTNKLYPVRIVAN